MCVLFYIISVVSFLFFFFFNDTATTEIYTLSLHDALPILDAHNNYQDNYGEVWCFDCDQTDRKSTRLNSSHDQISYAVFCLKKKKKTLMLNENKHKSSIVLSMYANDWKLP